MDHMIFITDTARRIAVHALRSTATEEGNEVVIISSI